MGSSTLHLRRKPQSEPSVEDLNKPSEADMSLSKSGLSSYLHSTFLPWIVACLLLLTITIGTYKSFSTFSSDNLNYPIHQLTRIPASSLKSPQATFNSQSATTNLPYFAKKTNFFNQKFVKLAWAWTGFMIGFHLLGFSNHHHTHDHQTQHNSQSKHISKIIGSFIISTVLWILLTQWFFGSSLIERLLMITGAKCVPSLNQPISIEPLTDKSTHFESSYCQRRWGRRLPGLDQLTVSTHRPYWTGGIDISGHTFILSFSMLLILSSLQPSLRYIFQNHNNQTISRSYKISIYANLALLALWWWMILMTSLYFHGPVEKLSGLVFGTGSWWLTELIITKMLN
ncbi:hypothetical protein O181_065977 [Austropuccinia psidii MF-1]|uniref:Uncharacterized protein n=1 Tax=Austropuccinia psidii MF-1 TaxID=1389203 RepID=A0A9Q3EYC6_9BASI|nr:hypothetical protein [Austropuccinia psidii MF-1]